MKICVVQEEPGGQRALIFDQGNRISQVRGLYIIGPETIIRIVGLLST